MRTHRIRSRGGGRGPRGKLISWLRFQAETKPALKEQGLWDDLTELAVSRALRIDGYAVVRAEGVSVPVAVPSRFVVQLSTLLSGLPRGMEDRAVSPIDFDREMDIEDITEPRRRHLFHQLRRRWMTEMRAIDAERRSK